MKILFVIENLANGGAERVLSFLSDKLYHYDINIVVLGRNFGFYEFCKEAKFHQFLPKKSGIFTKFEKVRFLRGLFCKLNPDLIISFIDWTNVLCVLANLGLKYKIIATEHHSQDYLKDFKFRFLRNLAYRKVAALSVLTKSDLEYYKFVKNCYIMHNPFYLNDTKSYKKENIILSVGRFEFVKGYDIYFRALKLVKKSRSDEISKYKIIIAGDGSLMSELRKMAAELDLDIDFLGHVSEISSYYARAKIFVLTSRSEGLSNVLIEAGYFGCARVSTKTIGATELIENEKNGLICKDENELASAIIRLIDDEKLIYKLGQNAKEEAVKFSPDEIFKKWENLIHKVVKK